MHTERHFYLELCEIVYLFPQVNLQKQRISMFTKYMEEERDVAVMGYQVVEMIVNRKKSESRDLILNLEILWQSSIESEILAK